MQRLPIGWSGTTVAGMLLLGCTTGFMGSLPRVDSLDHPSDGPQSSAYLEVQSNSFDVNELTDIFTRVMDESRAFAWRTIDPARADAADYRITLKLSCTVTDRFEPGKNLGDSLLAGLYAGTFCVTSCPVSTEKCTLSANIVARSAGKKHDYEVDEIISQRTFGVYSVPVGLVISHAGRAPIIDNQVRTIYRRMLKDRVFASPP